MIPATTLIGLFAAAVLPALWPVAIYLICRRRMTLSPVNIAIGAATFFVFSQVLEKLLHLYMLQFNQTTVAWFKANPLGYALYGCIAAGVFEETGRYLAMRFFVKPADGQGPAVAYGIGHGGIEAILIGTLGMLQMFVYAVMINLGTFDELAGRIPAEQLAQIKVSLQHVTLADLVPGPIERLVAVLIHIGLSLVVWRAVAKKEFVLFPIAILLHALVDFPPGLFQAHLLSSEFVGGYLYAIGIALAAWMLWMLWKLPPKHPQPTAL